MSSFEVMNPFEHHWAVIECHTLLQAHEIPEELIVKRKGVLPPLSVGEMTLRLYGTLNYSQNSVRDLRCALNGA